MLDTLDPKSITQHDLAALGLDEVAYVRRVVIQGEELYAIMAANGRQIGLAPDYTQAVGAIHDHNLGHAPLH